MPAMVDDTRVSEASVASHLLEEIPLELPFWRYFEMVRHQPYAFLLDSAKDPEKLGQYSFLGADPFLLFRAWRRPGQRPEDGGSIEVVERRSPGGEPLAPPRQRVVEADPFVELQALLDRYRIEPGDYQDLPLPFLSGAVGYFSYEVGYFIEQLPDQGTDDIDLPDIYFMFVDTVLGHCHRSGKTFLSVVGRGADAEEARERAEVLRQEALQRIANFEVAPPGEWTGPSKPASEDRRVTVRSFFGRDSYAALVQESKEHIFAGDIYEVCLTHRLEAPFHGDPWALYRELRRVNPAPFAVFLSFPEAKVVSSSPERFLSLDRSGVAESRPIKGTRPRGSSPEEDEAIARELAEAVKDRAENMMIVDLVRNDFGRVCKFHTVRVPELMVVEKYATVFQLVSTVRGELEPGHTGLDLVKACFPGGSMTGAPKIESMKIIDELEPVKRGIYSGSIGYLDLSGSLDLNIVIRTFVIQDGRCYYNVGGAVVADSDPVGEYIESMDKAQALTNTLRNLLEEPV